MINSSLVKASRNLRPLSQSLQKMPEKHLFRSEKEAKAPIRNSLPKGGALRGKPKKGEENLRLALYTLKNHADQIPVQNHAKDLSQMKNSEVEWILGVLAESPYTKAAIREETNGVFQYSNAHQDDSRSRPYRREDIQSITNQYKEDHGITESIFPKLKRMNVYGADKEAFQWAQNIKNYGIKTDDGVTHIPIRYYHYMPSQVPEELPIYKRVKFIKINPQDGTYKYSGRRFAYTPMDSSDPILMWIYDPDRPDKKVGIRLKHTYPLNNHEVESTKDEIGAYDEMVKSPHLQFIRFLYHGKGIKEFAAKDPDHLIDGDG